VSASVNLSLHHKVQKFSSGTGSPGWSWKKGHKTVVWVWYNVIFTYTDILDTVNRYMLKTVLIANSSYQQTIGNFQHNCPAVSVMRLPACLQYITTHHFSYTHSYAIIPWKWSRTLDLATKNMAAIISHDEGGNQLIQTSPRKWPLN